MKSTETQAFLAIIAGCAAIVISFATKQFYAARGVFGVTVSSRKIPLWAGRLLFLTVGIGLLFAGVSFFLFNQ
jgi:hypothetical protein